jgi:uncharacterized membrane protein YccF (DUF307 family)
LYITIIGIPFAHACFRIASFAFFPFGKELVDARLVRESPVPGTGLANFLWFVLAGVWLAIGHLIASVGCIASCLLIVPIFLGAPAWALAHLNLAKVSLRRSARESSLRRCSPRCSVYRDAHDEPYSGSVGMCIALQ